MLRRALSMLRRLPKIVMTVTRAFDLASQSRYKESLALLDELGDDSNLLHDGVLLRLFLYSVLDKRDETFSQCRRALQKIDEKHDSANIKRYLRAYAASRAQYVIGRMPQEAVTENILNEFRVDYSGINLAQVPAHLKRKFLLSSHPDWPTKSKT